MQQSQVRAGESRRLFEFLVASRPERERKSVARAAAASVAAHGVIVGLVGWATVAAAHPWALPQDLGHGQVIDLLTPMQSLGLRKLAGAGMEPSAKHAFAPRSRLTEDAPRSDRDREAAPAADAMRTLVRVERLVLPDPSPDIEAATRSMDHVLVSLQVSEYGGIGQDSATTRVAAILDDHHEPTTEQLASEGPYIGSFTQAPELTNPEQVQHLLSRDYPEMLKENGIGGRVLLWFLVDETGRVRRWLLKGSSGHAALDKAALHVASMMRFRPAWNYDRHVPLWIVLPITFMVDDAG